jgi:hypothetical protein
MERSENVLKIISKVEFYKQEELKCHVLIIPKGKFKNGIFVSELINESFFWFIEENTSIPIRLFLFEIYDIEDYQKREEI